MENRPDLTALIAKNLKYLMGLPGCQYRNANSLGAAAGLAANTIRNLLHPEKRTVTSGKPNGYPTLDTLELIAPKLNSEVWELLHPDIRRSRRERETYKHFEENYKQLMTEKPDQVTTESH